MTANITITRYKVDSRSELPVILNTPVHLSILLDHKKTAQFLVISASIFITWFLKKFFVETNLQDYYLSKWITFKYPHKKFNRLVFPIKTDHLENRHSFNLYINILRVILNLSK
jgi:hypothetical protein